MEREKKIRVVKTYKTDCFRLSSNIQDYYASESEII